MPKKPQDDRTLEQQSQEASLKTLREIIESQGILPSNTVRHIENQGINEDGNPEITYLLPIQGKDLSFAPDGNLREPALRITITTGRKE